MARKARNSVKARKGPSANAILTLAVVAVAVAVIGGILLVNRSNSVAENDGGISSELRSSADRNTLTESDGNRVTVVARRVRHQHQQEPAEHRNLLGRGTRA